MTKAAWVEREALERRFALEKIHAAFAALTEIGENDMGHFALEHVRDFHRATALIMRFLHNVEDGA
jgi:hypothetical protein